MCNLMAVIRFIRQTVNNNVRGNKGFYSMLGSRKLLGTAWYIMAVPIRVLARISKMPVKTAIHKISAPPDLATQILLTLITSATSSLSFQ